MKKTSLWLILILIIAAFFRFWDIQNTPPGLWSDEAIDGNSATEALTNKSWKAFYPENNGREGLYINIQSFFIKAFGHEPWVLRLPSAVVGFLTVLGLFLMARELFSTNAALFSAFFLATSFWHINFSRIGFRAIMAPFFLVWSFYFLLLLIRKSRDGKISFKNFRFFPEFFAIIAGVLFGLGFYTYIAFRIAPLILLLPLWKFLRNWRNSKTKNCAPCLIALFLFIAFITTLPLLWFYIQNPADFFGRTSQISIFNSPKPALVLLKNFVVTLGMFNFVGDFNWRHNFAGSPELWWPVGILFLIGIGESLRRMRKQERFPYIFLLFWFLVMLLPIIFSNEGIPHALRSITLLPPAMIFAGIGLIAIVSKIKTWLVEQKERYPENTDQIKRMGRELTLLLFTFFAVAILTTGKQYFWKWAPRMEVYEAFQGDATKIGHWLKSAPVEIKKYVFSGEVDIPDLKGDPLIFQDILFITDTLSTQKQIQKNIFYIGKKDLSSVDCSRACVLISVNQNIDEYKLIKSKIPNMQGDIRPGFFILKNKNI